MARKRKRLGLELYYESSLTQVYVGDAVEVLRQLPEGSIHTCITSPPYWGLRDYGVEGQLGLEKTPEEYAEKLVAVFRGVRRVLRDDGTVWLNLGDSYAGTGGSGPQTGAALTGREVSKSAICKGAGTPPGLKPKDLVGIPWRVAFALQADGWYLRSDIIWHKPNPMPESVTDRPTKAHEYIFLLSKSGNHLYWTHRSRTYSDGVYEEPAPDYRWVHVDGPEEIANEPGGWKTSMVRRDGKMVREWRRINLWSGHDYYYDAKAIMEPVTGMAHARGDGVNPKAKMSGKNSRLYQDRDPAHTTARKIKQNESFSAAVCGLVDKRNKRSVWTVATKPYKHAHFATFPPDLIKPCILSGAPEGGTVLDPFLGSGTTCRVASRENRRSIGIELNEKYCTLALLRGC